MRSAYHESVQLGHELSEKVNEAVQQRGDDECSKFATYYNGHLLSSSEDIRKQYYKTGRPHIYRATGSGPSET